MRAKELLQEMIVKYKSDDPTWVVAFKDSIWLLGYDDTENFDILEEILGRIGESTEDMGDLNDIMDYLRDSRPDVFAASINLDKKEIYYDMFTGVIHPKTSKLIKKVIQQMGIERINGETFDDNNENTVMYYPEDLLGRIPDVVYHGTSFSALFSILKKGLISQDGGNWEDIHTPGVIFFSVDLNMPLFHAKRAANNINSIPVILEFKLPDKNMVVPDYDVAANLYGTGDENLIGSVYQNTDFKERGAGEESWEKWKDILATYKRPEKLFGEFGVFGYKGRIPPSHILKIRTPFTEDFKEIDVSDWYTLNKEDFTEAYDIYESFGTFDEEFLGMEYKDIHYEIYGEYPEDEDE